MTTDNRTTLNACDSNSGWGGDDGTPTSVTAAGLTYENANSLSFQHTNAAEHTYYTDGTGWDLSDASVWLIVKVNQQDSQVNGGMQYVLGDGTDRLGVEIGGSDNTGVSLRDLFYGLMVDVTNRSSFTLQNYAGVNANLTTTAITQVGYGSVHLAKAQGAVDNIYLDRLSFIANDSAALTINGGTAMTPEGWTDVQGDDSTNGWGVCGNPKASQFEINCSFDMGDAGTGNSYFSMSGQQLYLLGQGYGATHAFWALISNSTGTNSLVIDGSQIISIASTTGTPYDLNWNSTNFNIINVTGSLFVDIGTWTMPPNSATRYVRTSTITNPVAIVPNGMEISDCVLNAGADTDADGMMLLDTAGDSNNSARLIFNSDGTGHAIEITATGTYDFDDFTYTGYGADGTTDAEVYNNSGGAVTINVQNGGDAPTVRNAAMSTTTINNAVTIRIDGVAEGTACKMIADETAGTVTAGDTLLEGIADSTGGFEDTNFNYEPAFGAGLDVLVRARNQGLAMAAVADDGGTQTDETSEANSPTTNDMTLTPAVPVVNDAYYFGHNEEFSQLKVWVTTAGANQTITWEYWNGAWVALSGVTDGTSSFTTTGDNTVSWTLPSDWADTTVNSQGPFRYVRARVSAIGMTPTGASGRQCQLDVTRYLPIPPRGVLQRTITSAGLTATLSQAEDTISRPFG